MDREKRRFLILIWALCSITLLGSSACSSLSQPTVPQSLEPTISAAKLGPTSTSPPPSPTLIPLNPIPTLVPIAPISDDDWSWGPDSALVTLLVYCDFQSPYCVDLAAVILEFTASHPEDLRIIYRHYPLLTVHDKASIAGQAAESAGQQGHFWDVYSFLNREYDEWKALDPESFLEWILVATKSLDLDHQQFEEDLRSGRFEESMRESFVSAYNAGINGTPFIFLNEDLFRLNPIRLNLEAALRLEFLSFRMYANPPEMDIDPEAAYLVHIQLNIGEVVLQLFPKSAPRTVNSFVFLAENGWFNGNPLHHVAPGKFVRTGDPTGTGLGGPGYFLPDEIDRDLDFSQSGIVALTSTGPNTNGSQFFITLSPLPELNGSRTIFGRVVRGLDLLLDLERRDSLEDLLTPPQAYIESIRIEVK
ncbi:MAG: peptidylprolyl isomerase [Anaerolineales bacterium]